MTETEEIIGDVRHGALRNPMLNEVLKRFGSIVVVDNALRTSFEPFLRQIGAKGRTCLEIGTYHGISAVVLSQYFDRVVCVSIDEHREELLKHQIVEYLGIKNIRFFDVEDNAEKAAVIDQVDFDFCYQDGDHFNDTHADFELAKRCGRVLLHEYWPIQPVVWNLVNSLPQNEIVRADFDCLAYWQRGGYRQTMAGAVDEMLHRVLL